MKERRVKVTVTTTIAIPNHIGKRFLRMIGDIPYIYKVYDQLYFQNGQIVLLCSTANGFQFETTDLNQNWEVRPEQD